LEYGHGRYGGGKEGMRIRILDEADFMETKFPSLLRKISYKARWSTAQGSPRE
jgi:hypothetical protein